MNYIVHLNKAFAMFCEDERLTPFHVSLYFGLFQYWNMAKFRNPISISRDELMRASKIGSVNTYIRCMKDLHNWTYIKYIPSYNPQKGSQVYLYSFDNSNNNSNDNSNNNGSDISLNKGSDKAAKKGSDKAGEKPVIPSINSLNKLNKQNNINENEPVRKKINPKSSLVITKLFTNEPVQKRKKVAPKKEKSLSFQVQSSGGKQPTIQELKSYFAAQQWTELEAEKFFNYYQSNGWLVGGKTPMRNWKAAAANWILNAENFKNEKRKSTSQGQSSRRNSATTVNKDYGEPL